MAPLPPRPLAMPLPTVMPLSEKPVTGSLKVTVTGIGLAAVVAGALEDIATVGDWLSTLITGLGPLKLAASPSALTAVLAAIEMLRLPLPEVPLMVTVRVLVPLPLTVAVPAALPEALTMTSASARVIAEAP